VPACLLLPAPLHFNGLPDLGAMPLDPLFLPFPPTTPITHPPAPATATAPPPPILRPAPTPPPPLRYRSTEGISVPFKVMPVIKELGRTRLEANVAVRALFGPKMFALGVAVLVPVPDNTAKCHISVTAGKAKYDATKKAIVSRPCARALMPPRAAR
jgi:hypothetical protein